MYSPVNRVSCSNWVAVFVGSVMQPLTLSQCAKQRPCTTASHVVQFHTHARFPQSKNGQPIVAVLFQEMLQLCNEAFSKKIA